VDYQGLPPFLYWIRYILVGQPIPIGGRDVIMHPIAWAGWAGFLVTALNLIPAGQLDGGHIMYVLLGKNAARLWPFIVVTLLALGFIWFGWFIWVALLFVVGRVYARPLNDLTPLDPRRKALALFGVVLFILVFTPVPFTEVLSNLTP
jgi:membrane-associated protease RseP (regulator of RpoE activity)